MLSFAVLCGDDQDSLSAVASVFDVGVEDVAFHDLRYYQGTPVPMVAEFEFDSTADGDSDLSGKNLPNSGVVWKIGWIDYGARLRDAATKCLPTFNSKNKVTTTAVYEEVLGVSNFRIFWELVVIAAVVRILCLVIYLYFVFSCLPESNSQRPVP